MLRVYQGRVAALTGAASGLGRALAIELAWRGCHLALIDNDLQGLLRLRDRLATKAIRLTVHEADVASEPAILAAVSEIVAAHRDVHLLINNAAISASAAFLNTTAAEFDRILRVNFSGAVCACRELLPHLQRHREGQILNVSSCFAWQGYTGKTAYAASKGALRAFSESLRLELAPGGTGVTLLYPGTLHTNIVRNGIADSEERRNREEQFLERHGLLLDHVARRALDRLLTNPSRIVIGFDYRALDALARFSPALAGRMMELVSARSGF